MAPTPQSRSQELINVKLLLIGNSSVGKSSLLLRFSDKQWLPEDEASATIGVDFRVRSPTFPSLLSLFPFIIIDVGTGVCVTVGCVVCCGNATVYQVHKLEVQGRKVKMSIWVRRCASFLSPSERTDAEILLFRLLGYYIFRTLQAKNDFALSLHRITAERRASYSVRVYSQRYAFSLPSWLTRIYLPSLAHAFPQRV